MKIKKILRKQQNMLSLLIIFVIGLSGCASDSSVDKQIKGIPQNAMAFINSHEPKNSYTSAKARQQLSKVYLKHYFAPWTSPFMNIDKKTVLTLEQKALQGFIKKPGWGENRKLHTKKWIMDIADNMNLSAYPNVNAKAIVINNTNLRMLPTIDPSFTDWTSAGEGYPFDNLQNSYLAANTPVRIMHTTEDGQWLFVVTPFKTLGWIKALDIAYVNYDFTKQWIQTTNYVTILEDKRSLFDDYSRLSAITRIGQIFPLYRTTKTYYKVFIPIKQDNDYAARKIINIKKQYANKWPLPATQKNVATIANRLLHHPYGWGGIYGYRDCSATMQAIFAPFAVWLPRNSTDQAKTGQFISFNGLNNLQKQKMIKDYATPFTTLIWMPGHIMLYLGEKDGQMFILHNMWGLPTKNHLTRKEGRAVVGRTVITPINFGHGYTNVPKTFLPAIQGMVLLLPGDKNG